jgi:hypothetical protein
MGLVIHCQLSTIVMLDMQIRYITGKKLYGQQSE